MSDVAEDDKESLAKVFRQTLIGIEGYHSLLLRGVDAEDTRHALEDICRYDAFKDGFLLSHICCAVLRHCQGAKISKA